MPKTNLWLSGTLRSDFMDHAAGEKAFVIKTRLKYKAIGTTYWLLFPRSKEIFQVAYELGGENLRLLFKSQGNAVKQLEISELASSLLANSIYRKHPKQVKELLLRSSK